MENRSFKIIAHHTDSSGALLEAATNHHNVEVKKYRNAQIPEQKRTNTIEAVKFFELKNWISLQTFDLREMPELLFILKYLKQNFSVYSESLIFRVELLLIILEKLSKFLSKNSINNFQDYVAFLEQDGLFFPEFQIIKSAKTEEEAQKVLKELQEKCLNDKQDINKPFVDYTYPPFLSFFSKFQGGKRNSIYPEDLLTINYDETKDPLIHIRRCEDILCSFNQESFPFINDVNNNLREQIQEYVPLAIKENDVLTYASFASGYLLRDLHVLQRLLALGYHKFEIVLVDIGYSGLIDEIINGSENLSLEHYLDVSILNKTLIEFGNWLSAQTDYPINIHIFPNVEIAKKYLNLNKKELSVLIGQDFFIPGGAGTPKHETPTAHADFMLLATELRDAYFFESIKNDLKSTGYLHVGHINQHKEYIPIFTTAYDLRNSTAVVYPTTSLGYLVNVDDKPKFDKKGEQQVKFVNNEPVSGTEPYYSFIKKRHDEKQRKKLQFKC